MKWMEKWNELRDYPTEQAERSLTVYLNTEPAGGRQTEAELKLKQGARSIGKN